MKTFLILLALSATVQAQTATVTWVQLNTLSEAQSFAYTLMDGSSSPMALSPVTCKALSGVTVCNSPTTLPGAGKHAYKVITPAVGAAVPILVSLQPGAPNGFTVTITVKPAMKP